MSPLLIVQMGSPPEALRRACGEQDAWFRNALADEADNILVVRPDQGEALPAESSFSAAVITGSWSMVTDRDDWSERTGAWARNLIQSGKPLLGVCYGHQLMADVMGGQVDYHPEGRELGTLPISLNPQGQRDPLLHGLPLVFNAHLSHRQSIVTPAEGSTVLAGSAHDPYQVVRYGPHAVSVQFHPEFNENILRACVVKRDVSLETEGIDVPALVASIQETPFARQVLTRFAARYSMLA